MVSYAPVKGTGYHIWTNEKSGKHPEKTVRMEGVEPTRPKAPDPKSGASTSSATSARHPIWARKVTTNFQFNVWNILKNNPPEERTVSLPGKGIWLLGNLHYCSSTYSLFAIRFPKQRHEAGQKAAENQK